MNDVQHITLTLNSRRIALNVEREQEPFYRKAAELLNEEYGKYQRLLPSASLEDLWMYVALKVAVNMFASTREQDLEPYLKKINELNKLMQEKLC